MNERYGIELDLVTAPFKQKINDTKVKIAELSRTISTLKTEMKDTEPGTNAFREYALAVDDAKQELEQLKNSQKGLKNLKGSFNDMAKSIDNGVSRIKKFGLALLSVRSAYRVVSKAANAYLSTNQELSNKMQSAWAGLGSMLAPILEWIANAMIKVVAYINVFIKALTGIDLLARASTKSIKGMGASAKSTSKQLAGFDTITNIGDTGGGGLAGGIENPFGTFENVQLDTTWVDRITDFANFIKDNWQFIVLGIESIALAIGSLKLSSILANAGLTGMLTPLLAISLAVAGLTSLVMGIIELFKEGGDQTKAWTLILGGLAAIVGAVAIAFGAIPALIAAIIAVVVAGAIWVVKNWETVKQFFIDLWNKIKEGAKSAWEGIKNVFSSTKNWLVNVFKSAWEGIKNVFSNVGSFFSGIWNKIVSIFKNIGVKVGDAIGSAFKTAINAVLKIAENRLNSPIKAINSLLNVINKVPGINISKLSTISLPKLATGTNYVPKDMTAVIHKGEAVVPKKFNSKEYFNGNSDETNRLLNALIITLENKDMNAYISRDDIGKASVNYINEKQRQSGRSLI